MVDIAKAILGTGVARGMTHTWTGDNWHQVVPGTLPDQRLLCKGFFETPCRFEEFRTVTVNGRVYVARGWDTSDRPVVYQLTEGGLPVSLWCPAEMNEGDWFRRAADVTRYDYASGSKVSGPDQHVTWLHFKKFYPTWTSPNGTTVQNAVELTYHDGEDGKSKPPSETYIFADGMVYWRDHATGKESYVNHVGGPGPGATLKAEPLPRGRMFIPTPTGTPTPPPQPTPDPVPSGWYWHRPVRAPYVVTSPFGERVRPEDWNKPADQQRKETHTGTDYTSADWTAYAAREGKVVIAGWDSTGFGNLVKLDHGGGYTSLYGHLEAISVVVGDAVAAGQKVGVIGSTGRSTARHLHLETRKDNVPYAPAPEMRPHPADTQPPPVIDEPPPDDEDTAPLPVDYEALYNELLIENAALRLRIENGKANVRYLAQEAQKAILQLEGVEG